MNKNKVNFIYNLSGILIKNVRYQCYAQIVNTDLVIPLNQLNITGEIRGHGKKGYFINKYLYNEREINKEEFSRNFS